MVRPLLRPDIRAAVEVTAAIEVAPVLKLQQSLLMLSFLKDELLSQTKSIKLCHRIHVLEFTRGKTLF